MRSWRGGKYLISYAKFLESGQYVTFMLILNHYPISTLCFYSFILIKVLDPFKKYSSRCTTWWGDIRLGQTKIEGVIKHTAPATGESNNSCIIPNAWLFTLAISILISTRNNNLIANYVYHEAGLIKVVYVVIQDPLLLSYVLE